MCVYIYIYIYVCVCVFVYCYDIIMCSLVIIQSKKIYEIFET